MLHKQIRNIFCMALLLCAVLSLEAQGKKGQAHSMPSKEKIQTEKKDFLTKELELSDKEAESLMTILNELDEQRFKLWQGTRELRERIRRGDKLSDAEYSQHFEHVMNNRVREAELERTYYTKCKTVLPMNKLVRLERANREFAKHFFKHKGR